MQTIHLKESVKTRPAWKALAALAEKDRRSMAGMAWVLILEGLERRKGAK